MARTPRKDPRNGPQEDAAKPAAGDGKLKAQKQRAKQAFDKAMLWNHILDEAYDYGIPYRKAKDWTGPEKRVDRLFDNTGPVSVFRFAGKLQKDLCPVGQEWFGLEPGPFVKMAEDKVGEDAMRKELGLTAKKVQAVFNTCGWDVAFLEMALDLSAGTGAMLILPDDDPARPVQFITVPMQQIAFDLRGNNTIGGIFWKRKETARAIADMFPDGKFDQKFKDALAKKPEGEMELCQDAVYDSKNRKWCYYAYLSSTDEPIEDADYRTCPWIVPRYWRVPGEAHGRGPLLVALPSLKTLNKTQELTLRAAALAILGIFTQIDDGVFNSRTARMEPGALWKVARNGGVLGPSIQRLDVPGNFNVSNIVLNEHRLQAKAAMLDEALPPETGGVRSATEVAERMKRLASDDIGAYSRHVNEIIVPAVRRVIDIMDKQKLIEGKIPMAQMLTAINVTSPMAMALKAASLKRYVEWAQLLIGLLGDERAKTVAKLEKMLTDMGHQMGVPAEYIYTSSEQEQINNTVQQLLKVALAAAMQQMQQQGAQGGAVAA